MLHQDLFEIIAQKDPCVFGRGRLEWEYEQSC
jgi:hypothetical protein